MNKRINESNWQTHYISKWNNRFDSSPMPTIPSADCNRKTFLSIVNGNGQAASIDIRLLVRKYFVAVIHFEVVVIIVVIDVKENKQQAIAKIFALRFAFCKYTQIHCVHGLRLKPNECYWNAFPRETNLARSAFHITKLKHSTCA